MATSFKGEIVIPIHPSMYIHLSWFEYHESIFLTSFLRIRVDLFDRSFNHHCSLSQVEIDSAMALWSQVIFHVVTDAMYVGETEQLLKAHFLEHRRKTSVG